MSDRNYGTNGISDKKSVQTLPLLQKLKLFLRNITVEPVLGCYILPSVLASIAVQNLNLEKACRVNKNFGEEFCTNLTKQIKNNDSADQEQEIQALVAYMNAWRLPLQTALPAIVVLFVGAWSDRTRRRKPYLLVPMLGELVTAVGLILCTYYFLEWPLEVAGVFEGLPPALTGGYSMMFMAVFSFIADNTTEEDRTFRIGMVNIFISVAVPIGTALSGIMLRHLGFYGVFLICIAIYVCGFIYGLIGVKEKKHHFDETDEVECKFSEFLAMKPVYETFMVLFKKRKWNLRLRVALLMLVYILVAGPVHGTGSIQYLYTRLKFDFDEIAYSNFAAYSIVMNLIGVIIGITLFTKILKMDDSLIGVIACTSKVFANVVYAFAPNVVWLYLGPLVEIVGGTGIIAMRSIATKVVKTDETGKINALFGVCDGIVTAIYPPLFSTFYVKTINVLPGAAYYLGAALTIPTVAIFAYMYIIQRKDCKSEKEELEKQQADNLAFENEITSL